MITNTGSYVEVKNKDVQQHTYNAFTPKPLMENSFFEMDQGLSSLLTEAHSALGILEGMDLFMPNRDILKNIFLYKEAYYSYLIDYPNSAPPFLWEDAGHTKNADVIENIIYAYQNMPPKELHIKTLEKIYGMTKHSSDSTEVMCVRDTPIFLADVISNLRRYSPTAPEHISLALKDMIAYLKNDQSDVLIKSAMAHYQFEMIHPFDCYNGIVGRMLVRKILLDSNHHATDYLSISEFLYENKNDYFDMLSSTQMSGGYIRWIKFFIALVINVSQKSCVQIKSYQQIVKRDEEKIQKSEQATIKKTLLVFEYWKRNLVSNITQPAKVLKLSYNTVERSVQLFQNLGIFKQLSSTHRNRQFAYSELADLFK